MNVNRKLHVMAVALVGLVAPGVAAPQECPTLPNQVSADIRASLSFDPGTALFTYGYAAAIAPSSVQPLESLVIEAMPPVSSVTRPVGWGGGAIHWNAKTKRIGGDWVWWEALRIPGPRRSVDQSSIVLPGKSLAGFGYQSVRPPGIVRYYAVGYLPPASPTEPCAALGADENEADLCSEALHERCPQLGLSVLQQAATGSTIGPVDAIPVQVAVKPGSSPAPVNPASQGVLPVAILGSASFDVRSVDASSVRLGVGQAASRSRAHVEDVNGDGIPDLLFQFPTQDAGVRCGDKFVIVAGRTTAGAALSGFGAMRTVDCP